MMIFHCRSKRVKIFSETFATKYLYKRDHNTSKRTCILIEHSYLKEIFFVGLGRRQLADVAQTSRLLGNSALYIVSKQNDSSKKDKCIERCNIDCMLEFGM